MDDDIKLFMALFLVSAFIAGVAVGWNLFEVTHNVICPETLNRCIPAPWS